MVDDEWLLFTADYSKDDVQSLYTNGNPMGQNSSGSRAPDNPMSIGGN